MTSDEEIFEALRPAIRAAQLGGFTPLPRNNGGHPAMLANVRQVCAMLRYVHLCGGGLAQEKLPFPGWVLRTARRRMLVTFESLDGALRDREGHTQIKITEFGRAFLEMRDCLRIGQEADQPLGLRDYDRDFSAVLLRGEAGFKEIPYQEEWE